MSREKKSTVQDLQGNPDYVILKNPLASPKFIRLMGKGNEMTVSDIYTPKIFYELASQLKPDHLIDIQRNQSIKCSIHLKTFLDSIGANTKNYKHLLESIEVMQSSLLRWKEGDNIITSSIVTKTVHSVRTGLIDIYVDSDIAKRILEIAEDDNFSFLKSNVFLLQNAQAIKLYPFFKSWLNSGTYNTDLERFKIQFGYDTSGYKYWSNLEKKVLIPAMEEINAKTDIRVTYKPTGEGLETKKPRIKGVKFKIVRNKKIDLITTTTSDQAAIVEKDTTTLEELLVIFQRISIEESPSEAAVQSLLSGLVSEIGYQQVKDGLLGIIDSKAKVKSIAFFTKNNLLKYPDFEKRSTASLKKSAIAQQQMQQAAAKKQQLESIRKAYQDALKKHLYKTYHDLSESDKQNYLQDLWHRTDIKQAYFKQGDLSKPNNFAIETIAFQCAFPQGYSEEEQFRKYALQQWNVVIDETGEI